MENNKIRSRNQIETKKLKFMKTINSPRLPSINDNSSEKNKDLIFSPPVYMKTSKDISRIKRKTTEWINIGMVYFLEIWVYLLFRPNRQNKFLYFKGIFRNEAGT